MGQTEEALSERGTGLWRRRLIVLAPVVGFLGLAALFMLRLNSGDPSRIPSALGRQNATEYNALVRTHLSRSADVSATIGCDCIVILS